MKNTLYLLSLLIAVGFTSCQKAPYATFQKSKSETFARTIQATPVSVEAVATQEDTNIVVPASNITASSSDEVSFEEPAALVVSNSITEIEEKSAVLSVAVSTIPPTTTTVAHVSGKNKLLSKILTKKINKLNKKVVNATSSSTAVRTQSLLVVGLVVIVIGLLLTLVPVLSVLSGIVIAVGAIIAIIGLLQQLGII